MVDDCLADVVLGAKVILGEVVPPHQELRLWGMWTSAYFFDSSGFGTAKSRNIATAIALRSSLIPGRVSGITSLNFNAAVLVFALLESWTKKGTPDYKELFTKQIAIRDKNNLDITHSSSAYEMKFKNGSKVRCIAPDFRGGAERVGSEDWHDGYFDEVTKYPDANVFSTQLKTRVRRPVRPYDQGNFVFQNHTYMGGTAKYTWHQFYPLVKTHMDKADRGDPNYEFQSWNYTHVPKEFRWTVNMKTIQDQIDTNARDYVEQEVMGRWTSDSSGYYSETSIQKARKAECPVLVGPE